MLPREYNPRFEDDFNAAADYDFDRSRAEARKLQRAMVKEKRGAMRELRRDAAFMAAVSLFGVIGVFLVEGSTKLARLFMAAVVAGGGGVGVWPAEV